MKPRRFQVGLGQTEHRLQPRLRDRACQDQPLQLIGFKKSLCFGLRREAETAEQSFVSRQLVKNTCSDRDELVRCGLSDRQQLERVIVEQLTIETRRLADVVLSLILREAKQLPRTRRVVDVNRVLLLGVGGAQRCRGRDDRNRHAGR